MTKIDTLKTEPLYRKLEALGGGLAGPVDRGEVAQEILDFLAMAARLKPVCLLGRGLDVPDWIAGAADVALGAGFQVIEGPFWDATPFGKFPDWYRDHTLAQFVPYTAIYICADRETAGQIGAINDAGGRLAMTEEARLLGYPDCCVVAHYDRANRYHQAIMAILTRLTGGDERHMQTLFRGGAALAPTTKEEIALMEAAFDFHPAPFGSWNQCPPCARKGDSPSAKLSEQYKALAESIDPDLSRALSDD